MDFKIDTGKLILCSMDIHSKLQKRPVVNKQALFARQILYTELQYHIPVVNSYVKFKTIAVYGRNMSLILVTRFVISLKFFFNETIRKPIKHQLFH